MKQVPVIIAGGGPVGMTLARDLARRGIQTLLIERNPTTTRHPKMDITNARSMELFRRLGVVDALRAVAVPEANNFDVSWITGLSGHELYRFRYPSVTQWRQLIRDKNDGSMPGEAPMRVSQVEIEPVLARAVQAEPLVDARWSVAFADLSQDADGVTVTLLPNGGAPERVRCDYLVGCDGGTSDVRRCLGIGLEGQASVQQRFMTHFRSDARDVLAPWGVAWHYQSLKGTLIAQNDRDIWTLQTRWPDDVPPSAIDPGALLRTFAGRDFDYEILVANSVDLAPAGGTVLSGRPRVSGRRRRASIYSDRRLRDEHGHRRRLRSRLEARRRFARLCLARSAGRPMTIERRPVGCATATPPDATPRCAARSRKCYARI